MLVELDIFSGVPNPQWHMAEPDREKFLKLLQKLPQQETEEMGTPGLGYRGFIVFETKEQHCAFDKLTIYRGSIKATKTDSVIQLVDKDRTVEYWLLEKAKKHLKDDLFSKVLLMMK